jgi:ABC-type transport system involved in multi-copper enzyme maturation permease subunit
MPNPILIYYELKAKFGGLLIWILGWSAMTWILAYPYDSISEDAEETQKVISSFPEEMRQAFNIQDTYLTQVESFISGQFLTFFMLIGSIYGAYLGANLIAGKIHNKTIADLMTKQTSRVSLFLSQYLVGLLFLSISAALIGTLAFIGFNLQTSQEEISTDFFLSLFTGATILHLFFLAFGQTLGILLDKSKGLSISAGLAVASWFINSLSSLAGFPDWLPKLTPFYYLDTDKLVNDFALDWNKTAILLTLTILTITLGTMLFRRKNVYL